MRRYIIIGMFLVALIAVPAAAAVIAPSGATVTGTTQKSVTIGGLACGQTYTFAVRLVQGGVSSKAVTRTAQTQPCTTPPPPPPTGLLTVASASCAARATCAPVGVPATNCPITPTAEVHTANDTANHTVGDGSYTWGTEVDPSYWAEWGMLLPKAQGQYTGTTDEQFQRASCRWGFSADLFRAVGVQETDWRQPFVGDNCGTVGEASYGIVQIKNRYCSGALAWGGYPDTQQSTALALDFYGAYMRACVDGAFYDGGSWLYGGKAVGAIATANGWDYVVWGCVGSWFSGGWYDSGATSYINSVKGHLANRDWTVY